MEDLTTLAGAVVSIPSGSHVALPGFPMIKAIFGFHPETKQMMVTSIHPGNTIEYKVGTMGFARSYPSTYPTPSRLNRSSCV